MQDNQNHMTIPFRLLTLLICIFFLTSCSLWSDMSEGFSINRTPSSTDIDAFIGTLKLRNGDPETMYRLAVHYQKTGRHDWAIDEFRKILNVDPAFARAYNGIGVSLDYYKKFELAQKAYVKALEIDPKLDYAWNNLGYSALLQGKPEAAAAYFEKAVTLRNDNPRYLNNLALAKNRLESDNDVFPNAMASASQSAGTLHGNVGKQVIIHQSTPVQGSAADAVDVILTKRASGPVLTLSSFASGLLQNHRSAPIAAHQNIAERVVIQSSKMTAGGDVSFTITPVTRIREPQREQRIFSSTFTVAHFPTVPDAEQVSSLKSSLLLVDAEKFDKEIDNFDGPYIEIANGNGVTGMAACVKRFLRRQGLPVIRASNADHFGYVQTKVYYSEGYLQQAWSVAKAIPGHQIFKKVDNLGARNVEIKVVIGKDMKPYLHRFEES